MIIIVFTVIVRYYVKAKAQNILMKVCLVINSMYGVFAIAAIAMMIA